MKKLCLSFSDIHRYSRHSPFKCKYVWILSDSLHFQFWKDLLCICKGLNDYCRFFHSFHAILCSAQHVELLRLIGTNHLTRYISIHFSFNIYCIINHQTSTRIYPKIAGMMSHITSKLQQLNFLLWIKF